MSYQGLNLIRYKAQKPLGEAKLVVVTPINIQAKLWSFPSRNRPAIGFLVGPTDVTLYFDMRTYDFIYSRIQNDFGWLSLEEVEIQGVKVTRTAVEGNEARYNIEWNKEKEDETELSRWRDNGGHVGSEETEKIEGEATETTKSRKTKSTNRRPTGR